MPLPKPTQYTHMATANSHARVVLSPRRKRRSDALARPDVVDSADTVA